MKYWLITLLLPSIIFCSEQKESNTKSPLSYYYKAKGLKTQAQKII